MTKEVRPRNLERCAEARELRRAYLAAQPKKFPEPPPVAVGRRRKGGGGKSRKAQRGGAILYLLAAVALFAALSVAFLKSTRTSTAAMEMVANDSAVIASDACHLAAKAAIHRLEARGCSEISWTDEGTTAAEPSGFCGVFHPAGGAVKICDASALDGFCDQRKGLLQIGERCGELVYAGQIAGVRRYANINIESPQTWNNGTSGATGEIVMGTTNMNDGRANTDTLVAAMNTAAPFQAARNCRAKGPKWYLPAQNELALMYAARTQGHFATIDFPSYLFLSSTEQGHNRARALRGWSGAFEGRWKFQATPHVCFMRD